MVWLQLLLLLILHHHHIHHQYVGCHLATDGGKNSVVDVEGVRRQDQGPKTLQVNMSVRKDVPEKNDIFGHCPKLPLPLPCTKFGQLFHVLKSVKMNLGRGSPPVGPGPKMCVFWDVFPKDHHQETEKVFIILT